VTLHTLTVPDDPADIPRWLERQLMAPDFGGFIAELSALFPALPGTDPPRDLLDRWLTVALTDGLQPIPPDVLRQLLRHPPLLAAFQEQIVLDGGAYWDAVSDRSDGLRETFARGRRALGRMLAADAAAPTGTGGPKAVHQAGRNAGPRAANRGGGRGYKLWAIISTGVAACLAVVVGLQTARGPGEPPIPKAQIAWGWAKPGGVAAGVPAPKDYLNTLAANVEEWSLHRPSDAAGLGARIAEFRTGCTRLLHSAYGPLGPADKAWLLEQCRTWAKALDGHLQALDGGADPLAVRAGVDETVRVVAAALRERAKLLR
jgi:hypothetical protein